MSVTEPEPAPDNISSLTEEATPVEVPAVDTPGPRLTQGWDRCDSCGAQAYVQVVIPTAPTAQAVEDWLKDENKAAYESIDTVKDPKALLFCKHHAEAYEDRLESVAVVAVDERSLLDVKLVSSY